MKLHELSPAKGSKRPRKRIGRGPGSGTGKTAGRGHKGQRSRSGYSQRLGFEGRQQGAHGGVARRVGEFVEHLLGVCRAEAVEDVHHLPFAAGKGSGHD